jgi:anti-sigma B factor antagonist
MASVELLTPDYGDYVVAQVRGELDIITATEFEASLNAIAAGGRCVIVDLGRLEFIDCSSLRLFGQAQELAALTGGELLLAAPRGLVRRVLTLTGQDEVLSVHASVAAAVASTNGGPARYAPGRPAADPARPGRAAPSGTGPG